VKIAVIRIYLLLISLFCGVFCSVNAATPQSIPQYIEEFRKTSTAVEFDSIFGHMIETFHAGKLNFKDTDVLAIIDIAKSKPFSNSVLAGVYGWAGTMFGDGRMEEAVAYFMESAFLYEKQKKKLGQALSCFEIALIQHKAGNFDEALQYYNLTLSLGKDSLGHRTRINCYNGFALISRDQGNYDSAMLGFRNAYHIAEEQKDVAWMGILSGNIASIHFRKKDYDSALHYYSRNLALIRTTTEVENEIETYASLAKVYLKKENERLAFAYLDSAMQIIINRKIVFNDFFNPMDEINETYARLYEVRGDYRKAFDYYTKFHEIVQEKQRMLNARSLKQLQSTYAFKQKQSELEVHVATIQQQRYTQIASGAIILLLACLVFFAYSTSRQRKKMNRDLSHSNEELERLNQVKDKLFSVISHDLRGPIANLKSILQLLDDGHLSREEFHELSSKLNRQLETSGNALENLLQWAKAQLSEIKVHREQVVMTDLVGRVIRQFHKELDVKDIRCSNDLGADLVAWADSNQVEIVIRNLIGNAVKFTPEQGVITVTGKRLAGNFIEISVEDSGIGMSDEQMNSLFQPGKYYSNLGTNQERGTGIGLIISKEMVVNNGGDISVRSSPKKGTVFTFTLPSV
jgi:signal transduction histidine kinase